MKPLKVSTEQNLFSSESILFHKSASFWLLFLLFSACGSNALSPFDEPAPEDKAILLLEKGKSDEAVSVLTKAIEKDPENYKLISLLSAAYAQKYGVDTLSFAEKLGTESAGSGNADASVITAMYPILPAATDANIAGIALAASTLASIPAASRTDADNFKLALLSTAETSIRTKKLDTNGDGILSPSELLTLDSSNAIEILAAIANAASSVAMAEAAGLNAEEAAAAVVQIQSALASQPGATDEEKLRNYLATNG